jgi:hypothetical protein
MGASTIPVRFGVDYATGYIGFTDADDVVSRGVAYFERRHRRGGVPVTHALVVSGDNEGIEAHIDEGVARVALAKYFKDPDCRIFFRRPRGWNPELGARIAASAAAQVGCGYATGLVVAEAAAETFAGHWLNRLFDSWPRRLLSRLLDRRGHWMCSELVAYALAQQPELRGRGVLRFPPDIIDPQELFEDTALFEDA